MGRAQKKKRVRRHALAKCAGCGSYRGTNGMMCHKVPGGEVYHCADCWAELERGAERDRCHVMAALVARYRSRGGWKGVE